MNRYFLTIFIFLSFTSYSMADEPPSWKPYKKYSENKNYFFWITFPETDTTLHPWEVNWKIIVFKADSTHLWEKDYTPNGYDLGTLTNDGKIFVNVDFWYCDTQPVVDIIKKDGQNIFIKGNGFGIPNRYLKKTVSHTIWLDKSFIVSADTLYLKTLDNKYWIVNLNNGNKMVIEKKYHLVNKIHEKN